jgi:hypothetical protein
MTKFEEFKADFAPYTDSFGLVQPDGGSGGNGLRYTAEYCVALREHFATNTEISTFVDLEMDRIRNVIKSCQKLWNFYGQMSPINGLYNRHPTHPDQESIDDYIGLGTSSVMLTILPDFTDIASEIISYGQEQGATCIDENEDADKKKLNKIVYNILSLFGLRKVKYVYNNVTPGKFKLGAWLGRFPNLICHLKIAAGLRPSLFEKIVWCAALVQSIFTGKECQDAYMLAWHMIKTYEISNQQNFVQNLMVKIWRHYQVKKFPGGPSEALASYFQNPSHPLVKWLKDVK